MLMFEYHLWLFLFALFMIIFKDTNLWIDMTGWTQSEFSYTGTVNIEEITKSLENVKNEFNKEYNNVINAIAAYTVSWEEKIVVETWFLSGCWW